MGNIIDEILEMKSEEEVNSAWDKILSEPGAVDKYMPELWERVVDFQTQIFGIHNALEDYKKGERDPSKLRTCLVSTGVDVSDLPKDDFTNPKLMKWINKKVAQILAQFSNLIARCRPLINQTPLGWNCSGIGLSLNFPWGVGLSFNFSP